MTFEEFDKVIRTKTLKRRELRGLPRITKPNMKKAYKRYSEEPKFKSMSEDSCVSYFVGWFIVN